MGGGGVEGKGLCFLENWIPAVWWTAVTVAQGLTVLQGFRVRWGEMFCCALGTASSALLCGRPLQWEAI